MIYQAQVSAKETGSDIWELRVWKDNFYKREEIEEEDYTSIVTSIASLEAEKSC